MMPYLNVFDTLGITIAVTCKIHFHWVLNKQDPADNFEMEEINHLKPKKKSYAKKSQID